MATSKTKTRSPVELVTEAFELLNKRDADAMLKLWADDVVEEFPTGIVHGATGMRDYFAEVFAALSDFHMSVEKIIGTDDTVFVKWRLTGTFDGAPFQGIEPTGDHIDLPGMDCFTIRDGLVVHNFIRYDQLDFVRQIGMLPPQGSRGDRAMTAAFNAKTRASGVKSKLLSRFSRG